MEFSQKNREVVTVLLKAISKSLGLEESYIDKATNIELGLQILAANYYPACPEPDRAIGIPSHTDHGLLTLLVDNGISGLQILHKEKWINVNLRPNALFVHIADHLEVHSILHLELHFYYRLHVLFISTLSFSLSFVRLFVCFFFFSFNKIYLLKKNSLV